MRKAIVFAWLTSLTLVVQGPQLIERMFCRLKDFRRVATRCDKRADIFISTVLLAATFTWWLN